MSEQVWLITGASRGLGKSLALKLLKDGQKVAATSRSVSSLLSSIGISKEQANFLPLEVNLSSEESIQAAVKKIKEKWGRVDVLVNNAGFGQFGAVEEVSDSEARGNFEVNVFGLLNVIRGVLPEMRSKRSGHIFNISSIGGYVGSFPGVGVYCATKFAVAGLSEGLKTEVGPLGIDVTLVYPGYFRTDFLSKESMTTPKNLISDYKDAQAVMNQHAQSINQNQPGDPEKLVDALIKVSKEKNPPFHLFLGPDSFEMANKKISEVTEELKTWKELSISTNL